MFKRTILVLSFVAGLLMVAVWDTGVLYAHAPEEVVSVNQVTEIPGMVEQASAIDGVSLQRRVIKCSDDGRLCLICYYDRYGRLIYCDMIFLPPPVVVRP